jgi:hypothetical protein
MRYLYSFAAGCLIVFVLLRAWQLPIGRFQMIWTASANERWPDQVLKLDTVTGRIVSFHISGSTYHEIQEITVPTK